MIYICKFIYRTTEEVYQDVNETFVLLEVVF